MQSRNGDVELSVTLSTKGLKSDVQEIKKSIEDSLEKEEYHVKPVIDDRQLNRELQKISNSGRATIEITPEVDENKLKEVNELFTKASGFNEADGWTASSDSINAYLQAYLQLSDVEMQVHNKWLQDNAELINSNKNASESVKAIKEAVEKTKASISGESTFRIEPEVVISTDEINESIESTKPVIEPGVVVETNAINEAIVDANPKLDLKKGEVQIETGAMSEAILKSEPVLNFGEGDIKIDKDAIQNKLDSLFLSLNISNITVNGKSLDEALIDDDYLQHPFENFYKSLPDIKREWKELTDKKYIDGLTSEEEAKLDELYGYVEKLTDEEQNQFIQWKNSILAIKEEIAGLNTDLSKEDGNAPYKSYDPKAVEAEMAAMAAVKEEAQEATKESEKLAYVWNQDIPKNIPIEEQIKNLEEETRKAAEEANKLKSGFVYSNEYKQSVEDVGIIEKELQKAQQQLTDIVRLGGEGTAEYEKLADKVTQLEGILEQARDVQKNIVDDGNKWAEGYDSEAVANAEKRYDTLAQKLALLKNAQKGVTEEQAKFRKELSSKVYKTFSTIIKGLVSGYLKLGKVIGTAALNVGKMGLSKLIGGFKNLTSALHGSNKAAGLSIKNMIGMALGIRGLFGVISKLRSYITEGLRSLALYNNGNNEVNKNISMLMTSLNGLKGAWASAFAPILTAVAPILNTFINILTQAANAIAQFLSLLTGKSTWMKATATQQDWAASLGAGAGNAKKAKNETKKANDEAKKLKGTLAGFDDLDVLDPKADDGLDKLADDLADINSGGGGAGAPITFEETAIDPYFKGLLDRLKEMWKNADFTELGREVGEWLKKALDSIPWDIIKNFASKLAKSIATFINGFVETEGLGASIGHTLAEALNTAFIFLYDFVKTLHWDSVGKFIGEAILQFVRDTDWEKIGGTLGATLWGVIQMAFHTVKTFAEGGGFEELGQAVSDIINNFFKEMNQLDAETGKNGWEMAGNTIYNLAHGLVTALSNAIKKTDWKEIGYAITNLLAEIDFFQLAVDLSTLAVNLLSAIADIIKSTDWKKVGQSIAEFINGIDFVALAGNLLDVAVSIISGIGQAIISFVSNLSPSNKMVLGLITALIVASKLAGGGSGILTAAGHLITGFFSKFTPLFSSRMATSVAGGVTAAGESGAVGAASVGLGTKIAVGIMTAIAGYHIGNWIGRELLPGDNDQWYDMRSSEIASTIIHNFNEIPGAIEEMKGAFMDYFGAFDSYKEAIAGLEEKLGGLKEQIAMGSFEATDTWIEAFRTKMIDAGLDAEYVDKQILLLKAEQEGYYNGFGAWIEKENSIKEAIDNGTMSRQQAYEMYLKEKDGMGLLSEAYSRSEELMGRLTTKQQELQKQFADGTITETEYRKAMNEVHDSMKELNEATNTTATTSEQLTTQMKLGLISTADYAYQMRKLQENTKEASSSVDGTKDSMVNINPVAVDLDEVVKQDNESMLTFKTTVTELGTAFDGITPQIQAVYESLEGIKSVTENATTYVTTMGTNITNAMTTMKNNITLMVNTMSTSITTRISTLKTNLETYWTGLKENTITTWTELKTSLITTIQTIYANLTTKVNAIYSELTTKWTNLKNDTIALFKEMKDGSGEGSPGVNGIMRVIQVTATTEAQTLYDNLTGLWTNLETDTLTNFENIKKGIIGIFQKLQEDIKTPINGIIGIMEGFINTIVHGVNDFIDKINAMLQIAAKLPAEIEYDVSLTELNHLPDVELPRLATGAVIPPNREFLAMLGDQKYGTNIEAPLDTIKAAFEDVVANMQVQNVGSSIMELDGQEFARIETPYIISELERRGYNVKVLEA